MRLIRDPALRESDHVQRVTIEHSPLGHDFHIRGNRFVATLNADTNDDYTLPTIVEFQGVKLEVANQSDGDYTELFLMVPGETPIVAAQFGHTVYVPPSGVIQVIADGTVTFPAGCFLRVTYHSIATTGPQPIVYYDYWIWEPAE